MDSQEKKCNCGTPWTYQEYRQYGVMWILVIFFTIFLGLYFWRWNLRHDFISMYERCVQEEVYKTATKEECWKWGATYHRGK